MFRSQVWIPVNPSLSPRLWPGVTPHSQEQTRTEQSHLSHLQVFHRPWSSFERAMNSTQAFQTSCAWGSPLRVGVEAGQPRPAAAPGTRMLLAPALGLCWGSKQQWCKYIRTSLGQWFGRKTKQESNPKLCHLSGRIRALFKTRDFFSYFLCLYDSSEFIFLF